MRMLFLASRLRKKSTKTGAYKLNVSIINIRVACFLLRWVLVENPSSFYKFNFIFAEYGFCVSI